MARSDDGHFTWDAPSASEGLRYAYRLSDGRELPDPASRWQPEGVHKPSAVLHPEQFAWTDSEWRGVSRSELVIYELHVGTFTAEGTFEAIIPRLADLRELGVTAIEIMPVGQFSGARNWGYDVVHPSAAQNSYGGPRGLQRLVDAAHRAGVGVILDVVYNHLGPEGNYFSVFAPYFTDRYHTPWGSALNFDGPDSDPVRKFVIDNARMWVRDFHVDGLRLDAVQTIYDSSAKHILAEVQEAVQEIGAHERRGIVVIAETNQNDVRLVAQRDEGGYGLDGVWSDDFHHSVHALLTGERDGYYVDFGEPEQLAKAFRDVFVYDGRYSPFHRRRHGNRAGEMSREHFVCCIQNHDQIGNRAMGDRLASSLTPAEQRLAAALLLLAPTVPLLFMGEEYGETRPFPFFCSFSNPGLVEAVRQGRRAELESVRFKWQHEPPDPHSPDTFGSAVVSWNWVNDRQRNGLRRLYQDLLKARRSWPALVERHVPSADIIRGPSGEPCLRLALGSAGSLEVCANLSRAVLELPPPAQAGAVSLFSSASHAYGGDRDAQAEIAHLEPFECVVRGPAGWCDLRQGR